MRILVAKYTFCVYNIKKERILQMKHRDLIKRLEAAGFVFYRHGGNHDIYIRDGKIEQVPRHKEINEQLAKAIIRKWNL